MTTKTFDKRVRAVAAALKELGKSAAEGTHYALSKEGKRWAWEPVKAKSAKEKPAKGMKKPGVVATIPTIVSRPQGATLAEIVKTLKVKFPEREEKKLASTTKVNMRKACEAAGVTLWSERAPGKLIRYFGKVA